MSCFAQTARPARGCAARLASLHRCGSCRLHHYYSQLRCFEYRTVLSPLQSRFFTGPPLIASVQQGRCVLQLVHPSDWVAVWCNFLAHAAIQRHGVCESGRKRQRHVQRWKVLVKASKNIQRIPWRKSSKELSRSSEGLKEITSGPGGTSARSCGLGVQAYRGRQEQSKFGRNILSSATRTCRFTCSSSNPQQPRAWRGVVLYSTGLVVVGHSRRHWRFVVSHLVYVERVEETVRLSPEIHLIYHFITYFSLFVTPNPVFLAGRESSRIRTALWLCRSKS